MNLTHKFKQSPSHPSFVEAKDINFFSDDHLNAIVACEWSRGYLFAKI